MNRINKLPVYTINEYWLKWFVVINEIINKSVELDLNRSNLEKSKKLKIKIRKLKAKAKILNIKAKNVYCRN